MSNSNFSPIYINDFCIHSEETACEYFNSIGLETDDLYTIAYFLFQEKIENWEYQVESARDMAQEEELCADAYLNCITSCINLLEDLYTEMKAAPRNKSKAYFADKLLSIIENDLKNYG